jgi:hypothetical protein
VAKLTFPLRAEAFEFAFDFFAMRRVCAENWAASIPCAGATGQFRRHAAEMSQGVGKFFRRDARHF